MAYLFACVQVRTLTGARPSRGLWSEGSDELQPTAAKRWLGSQDGEDRMDGGRRRNRGQGIRTEIVLADGFTTGNIPGPTVFLSLAAGEPGNHSLCCLF